MALDESALFAPLAELRESFELELDEETFVDRIGSISFIAALDDERRGEVLERVRALAAEHREPWSYVTEVYVYERARGTVGA